MKLSVLGIACSPRRHGNTSLLLEEVLKVAVKHGHDTEILYLSDMKFSPCQGCNACSRQGICVLKDDMQDLQQKLKQIDRLIIAAPVFFMGINAQAKAMIDRMQPFWALKYKLNQSLKRTISPYRKGMFLSAAGTELPGVFDCAERSVKVLFHMLDIDYITGCLYKGVDEAGAIKSHPSALEEVHQTAEKLFI